MPRNQTPFASYLNSRTQSDELHLGFSSSLGRKTIARIHEEAILSDDILILGCMDGLLTYICSADRSSTQSVVQFDPSKDAIQAAHTHCLARQCKASLHSFQVDLMRGLEDLRRAKRYFPLVILGRQRVFDVELAVLAYDVLAEAGRLLIVVNSDIERAACLKNIRLKEAREMIPLKSY